jgi:uncharacterized membrane-anchored protein
MKRIHMPIIDARYWLGITLASIFGTNLGDLYAHETHLGIYRGIAVLAVLAAGVFAAERRDAAPKELFYWLVIIIIRTGATNIADYLAFKVRVQPLALTLGLAFLIGLFGWLANRNDMQSADDTVDLPPAGFCYWSAMLSAGVFGTVLGDICSHFVGQGIASLALDVVLAVALAIWAKAPFRSVVIYWATVATARTAGTAMGDWFAENKILDIGLPIATLITGTAFVMALLLWRSNRTPAPLAAA